MKTTLLFLFTSLSLLCRSQSYPEPIYSSDGAAIGGYDAVSYFTKNEAVKGSKDFTYSWNGASWRFASESNRDLFKANPEKYAPQYGGYCAWGMSNGYKAKVDPLNAWTISNGKLYLNYSKSIKSKWLPEKDELIKKADTNWKKFE